jgi:hypothetical protein
MHKRAVATVLSALGAVPMIACAATAPPTDTAPATSVEPSAPAASTATTPAIHADYRGVFHAGHRFDPETGHMGVVDSPPRVIRDAAEMADFVALIPRDAITKTNPAPPSEDPLLAGPSIDWSRHVVLVGFRSDTMYGDVVFQDLRRDGDDLRVRVLTPEPGPERFGAQPLGVGAYRAIVVDRVPGTVHFDP